MLIQRKPYASIQKQLNSFIDEEGDKVVIGNDNDLKYFKDGHFGKIRVEERSKNNERILNRDVVKDAMKLKIM